jgi:hypothetical protein
MKARSSAEVDTLDRVQAGGATLRTPSCLVVVADDSGNEGLRLVPVTNLADGLAADATDAQKYLGKRVSALFIAEAVTVIDPNSPETRAEFLEVLRYFGRLIGHDVEFGRREQDSGGLSTRTASDASDD